MKKTSEKGKNVIGLEKNKSRNEGWFVAMEEAEERGLMVAGGEKEREREQSQKDKKEKEECCRQSHLFTKKIIHTFTLQPVHLIFSPFHIKILI